MLRCGPCLELSCCALCRRIHDFVLLRTHIWISSHLARVLVCSAVAIADDAHRFLLFKLMLMSGVVKIMSNDRTGLSLLLSYLTKTALSPNPPYSLCSSPTFSRILTTSAVDPPGVWLQLTALNYHFASQPIPTPVAWYIRQMHPLILQLGTAFTFILEIPCPFLVLVPFRSVRHGVAVVQASLQVKK